MHQFEGDGKLHKRHIIQSSTRTGPFDDPVSSAHTDHAPGQHEEIPTFPLREAHGVFLGLFRWPCFAKDGKARVQIELVGLSITSMSVFRLLTGEAFEKPSSP